MPKATIPVDQTTIYEAALEGLELQKKRIEEQIQSVRAMLGYRSTRAAAVTNVAAPAESESPRGGRKSSRKPRKKRNLSPEARLRIAEAQKKRWAAYRKEN